MKKKTPKRSANAVSIRALLFFANGIIFSAGFAFLIFHSVKAIKATAEEQTKQNLGAFAEALVSSINTQDDLRKFSEAQSGGADSLRVTIIDSGGRVVSDSAVDGAALENHLGRSEVAAALNGERATATRRSAAMGCSMVYCAAPLQIEGEKFALRVSAPLHSNVYFSSNIKKRLVFAGAIVFAAIIFLSQLSSAFIIGSIDNLKNQARQYKGGNFDFKSNAPAPKEISSLRESMEDMAAGMKRLERTRKDFVANVSHELKTPVTSIVGFSETLLDSILDKDDNDDARRFVKIIHEQSARLSAIIDDLLTLSRLEQGGSPPECVLTNIVSLCEGICDSFSARAKDSGISLEFQSSQKTICCMANESLFERALANVIDNALKYCPRGSSVVVGVSGEKENGKREKSVVKIFVEDDGQGIPEAHRARVFERFYRVDKGRSRKTGGTGLGLSIAAHIVRLHQGSIIAEARGDGKSGARFVITLPSADAGEM